MKTGKLKSLRGFTLIEVLIVIVILGVLAGLAVPIYTAQVNRARAQEALQYLQSTRSAMQRYYSTGSTYVGANITTGTCNVDFCPNDAASRAGGVVAQFAYSFSVAPTAANYTIRALYTGAGATANDWIDITAAGAVNRNPGGIFA